jgi:hypothetical protein
VNVGSSQTFAWPEIVHFSRTQCSDIVWQIYCMSVIMGVTLILLRIFCHHDIGSAMSVL